MTAQPHKKNFPERLIGIDLFRGVAAYGVVAIHTSAVMIYSGFSTDLWTAAFTAVSRFAVPFFLAASFYLMTSKIYVNERKFNFKLHLKSKWQRLVVPYLCWSAIYLLLRTVKALSRPNGLVQLFQDSVGIVFLGGASIHLYFIPLLFLGSFLIVISDFLARKKVDIKAIIFLFIFSMIVYEIMIVSGNAFQFGFNCLENANSCSVAFQELLKLSVPNAKNNQIIRLVLVALAWCLQCLPYIFMAMGLHHPILKKTIDNLKKEHASIFLIVIILFSILNVINIFKIAYFPQSLYELGIAISTLLLGLCLSKNTKGDQIIIENLGVCSFGIYLTHYLILIISTNLFTQFLMNLSPIFMMFIMTTISFLLSWLITYLLIKNRLISRIMFGN